MLNKFLNIQMKKRLQEFSVVTNLKVFCGTFNTNARELSEDSPSLSDWLTPPHLEVADVYAIGMQEIVPLNPKNVAISGSQSVVRAAYWQEQIQNCLDATGIPFVPIVENHLVGIALFVFARVSLLPQISDLRTSTVGIGIMGMMGNKGAVSARMTIYESSICFVCSHFQANREAVIGRNCDFRNILEKTVFLPSPDAPEQIRIQRDHDRASRRWAYAEWLEAVTILDHDFVFWLGDLNYRIDEQVPTERVFAWCHSNSWEMMRDVDQLNIERSKGAVFNSFSEARLSFPPTYKYIPGTTSYDNRAGAKIRAPAWCDRVLWRIHHPYDLCLLTDYRCAADVTISDHRPVSAFFEVGVRIAELDKEKEIYLEQLHYLDKLDNEMTPTMSAEGLLMDFGAVVPMIPASRVFTLVNTGGVLASWELSPKHEESTICKPWIAFSKQKGILAPKEVMEVTVTVDINPLTCQEIIEQRLTAIDDIVVITVKNGRHFFCSISATVDPSQLESLQRQPRAGTKATDAAGAAAVGGAEDADDDEDHGDLDYGSLYPSNDTV